MYAEPSKKEKNMGNGVSQMIVVASVGPLSYRIVVFAWTKQQCLHCPASSGSPSGSRSNQFPDLD